MCIYSRQLQTSLPGCLFAGRTSPLENWLSLWSIGVEPCPSAKRSAQNVQLAPQETAPIITTLHSHQPAMPEQFLCFRLIKISEVPQPSVNSPCFLAVISPEPVAKQEIMILPGQKVSLDKYWGVINKYSACLFCGWSRTSAGGGESSGFLVCTQLWQHTVYSTRSGQKQLAGQILRWGKCNGVNLNREFPWASWVAPFCVGPPSCSSKSREVGKELNQSLCGGNGCCESFFSDGCSPVLARKL